MARHTVERAIEGQGTAQETKRRAEDLVARSQELIAEVRRLSRCPVCALPLSTGGELVFRGTEQVHAQCSTAPDAGGTESAAVPNRAAVQRVAAGRITKIDDDARCIWVGPQQIHVPSLMRLPSLTVGQAVSVICEERDDVWRAVDIQPLAF